MTVPNIAILPHVAKRLSEMEAEPRSRQAIARFVFVTTLNARRADFATQRGFEHCRTYLIRTAAPRFANDGFPCTVDVCRAAASAIIRFHATVDRRYA